MDRLWSPWRYAYISQTEPTRGCLFCNLSASTDDRENLVVYRGKHNFVVLNRFPYTSGHLMVAPYVHVPTLEECDEVSLAELMLLTRAAETRLRSVYKPEGMNIGMNIGACAGAGVAGHIHMHVVPRWTGDANFMSITGETRVFPEDLATTYERVVRAFNPPA
jgi:ATP adenylyltransferase